MTTTSSRDLGAPIASNDEPGFHAAEDEGKAWTYEDTPGQPPRRVAGPYFRLGNAEREAAWRHWIKRHGGKP